MEAVLTRRASLVVLPAAALLLATIAPLVSGARTLFLRDVTATHLELRAGLGRALRAGELPLVDGARAGGQGLLGNPNAVPLYPDNLLLLVASDLWQLNAHFWLHWLVALPAMYALARCWGLGREASWAAAVVYAFSGYFVSQLNLYNAVAGVALAPALAAALLASGEPRLRRWALPAFGGVWALELLGGDPIVAVLALGTALALGAADRRRLPWAGLALALVAGTLVAAPQWVEMLRLLPGSYRGFWGLSPTNPGRASPSLPAALELLLPFFFGRPDQSVTWGIRYFGGTPPLYFSLAPGLLTLAAVAAALGERSARVRWATGVLVASAAIVYSGELVGGLIARLPGGGLFRYNVKFALAGMLSASLLAARALERAWSDARARARLARALAALSGIELGLAALLLTADGALARAFLSLFARGLPPAELAGLRAGWAVVALWQAFAAAGAWLLVRGSERWPATAPALLLALHASSQLLTQRAQLPTDESGFYRRPPALLAEIPPAAVTTSGGTLGLFGGGYFDRAEYPDRRAFWRVRRAYDELHSFALHAAGRRSEFDLSAEGLDAFPTMATASALRGLSDPSRVRILAATGVDRLVLPRPLDSATGGAATLLRVGEGRPPIHLYRVERALADAQLLGSWRFAPHMNAGIEAAASLGFDPAREALLAGEGEPREGPPGRVEIVRFAADEIELAVDSEEGGAVVVRRAWLSIWRVEVDGREVPVRIANLTRLAVEVPPGAHRVRFFVPRWPSVLALAASLAGMALILALLGGAASRSRGRAGDPVGHA